MESKRTQDQQSLKDILTRLTRAYIDEDRKPMNPNSKLAKFLKFMHLDKTKLAKSTVGVPRATQYLKEVISVSTNDTELLQTVAQDVANIEHNGPLGTSSYYRGRLAEGLQAYCNIPEASISKRMPPADVAVPSSGMGAVYMNLHKLRSQIIGEEALLKMAPKKSNELSSST